MHVSGREDRASYLSLLRTNRGFRRLFLAQFVSSLGDWVAVIAIAVYATRLGGPTGVGVVMTARVLPGFVIGPVAGVLADRWDRRKTMIFADLMRAALIFSLPFLPTLWWFLIVSAVMECLGLLWSPAKDASLPNIVKRADLTRANSLALTAAYAPWPLASVVFFLLSALGSFLGTQVPSLSGLHTAPESLALWMDSLTFVFSAVMVAGVALPRMARDGAKLDVRQVVRDLVDGVVFIRDHPKVRPWLVGIGLTFAAAGAVFALGVDFVRSVLGGGEKGFSSVIGFLAAGMIIGLLSTSVWVRRMHKDILFSASILLLGVGLIAFASMGSLSAAIPLASALGFFGGIGYSVGYSLLHETTDDDVRGRTFSVAYTVIRIGMLGGLGLFPVLAGAIGHHHIGGYPLPGARITLWAAGLIATGGGLLSMRAIRARAAEGRPEATAGNNAPGFFLVFEGADGAGKTTQIQALVRWLQARGDDVVVTREPGGTEIGRRIRALLLDSSSQDMDPRTEALLYAADRAQHVAQVIRPALQSGKVVVSDRFIDSSLAYQGIARGLGVDAISDISSWGTNGLLPDLVVFLDIDRGRGMERLGSALDRIEGEGREFQQRVNLAYRELAAAHPERFVVLDADRPPSEIHEDVKRAFLERCESPRHTPAPGAAGPPAVGESPQGAEPSSAETSPTRPLR